MGSKDARPPGGEDVHNNHTNIHNCHTKPFVTATLNIRNSHTFDIRNSHTTLVTAIPKSVAATPSVARTNVSVVVMTVCRYVVCRAQTSVDRAQALVVCRTQAIPCVLLVAPASSVGQRPHWSLLTYTPLKDRTGRFCLKRGSRTALLA